MRVKRIVSNNAVLALRGDDEVVVLGRGVGFGRRPGDDLAEDRVERIFLAEDTTDDRLSLMLADIPLAFLRVAGQIADLAHEELGIRAGQSLILPLADHLAFAQQRAENGSTWAFPLAWEVSQLYPAEYRLGQRALALAQAELGTHFDPDEAVAIAMHLVNVQFAMEGHTEAMVMTETIARILTLVEQTFAITIDRHSMNCARFVTHLRYLFARVASGEQITDPHPTLFEAISNAHPDAMACASKIQYLIEVALSTTLTLDEIAYLALHVARLLADHQTLSGSGGGSHTLRTQR